MLSADRPDAQPIPQADGDPTPRPAEQTPQEPATDSDDAPALEHQDAGTHVATCQQHDAPIGACMDPAKYSYTLPSADGPSFACEFHAIAIAEALIAKGCPIEFTPISGAW